MIFRQPSNSNSKIGRKIEFNNPLRFSNKKHYWNGGIANYGLLTTQQIEMLKEMKERERRAQLFNMKGVQHGLNYSVKEIKYRNDQKQKKSEDFYKKYDQEDMGLSHESLEKQIAKQSKPKRSVSEYRCYEETDPSNEKCKTIDCQQDQLGRFQQQMKRDGSHNKKRVESGKRRVKTIGMEQFREQANPEERNRIEEMFDGLIDKEKQRFIQKRHLRMESGNIRVKHSPETTKNMPKWIEKSFPSLDTQIYSDRSHKQIPIEPNSTGQRSKTNPPEQLLCKIETNMLKINKKKFTKLKFQRDHSPTFCNSIDYPLKYFRHV